MSRPFAFAWLILAAAAPQLALADPAPVIRIQRDSSQGNWGLEATNARLGDIAKVLSRSMGCEFSVDEKAADRRVNLLITSRSPERLVPLLGRRANVSAALVYRFEMDAAAGTSSPSGFGKDLVAQELREPVEVEEALRVLRLPVEIGKGVRGKVRLNTLRMPVNRVLDQVAAQTGSQWSVVIRIKGRTAADEVAAKDEEPRFLYSDLSRLSPGDRREEIGSDVDYLMGLPDADRAEAVRSLAGSLTGMTAVVRDAQENRGTVSGNVASIAQDYGLALRRLPADNRAWAAPLYDALRELTLQLRTLQ